MVKKVKIITKEDEKKLQQEVNEFIKSGEVQELIDIKYAITRYESSAMIIYDTYEGLKDCKCSHCDFEGEVDIKNDPYCPECRKEIDVGNET